jgi:hypothetical protein
MPFFVLQKHVCVYFLPHQARSAPCYFFNGKFFFFFFWRRGFSSRPVSTRYTLPLARPHVSPTETGERDDDEPAPHPATCLLVSTSHPLPAAYPRDVYIYIFFFSSSPLFSSWRSQTRTPSPIASQCVCFSGVAPPCHHPPLLSKPLQSRTISLHSPLTHCSPLSTPFSSLFFLYPPTRSTPFGTRVMSATGVSHHGARHAARGPPRTLRPRLRRQRGGASRRQQLRLRGPQQRQERLRQVPRALVRTLTASQ